MRMWYVYCLHGCIIVRLRVSTCVCIQQGVCVHVHEVCIPVFVQGRKVGFSCMCTHVYAVVYSLWCVPYFLD